MFSIRTISNFIIALVIIFAPFRAFSEPMHGISMSGSLALEADFANLPYVNPDAPKGGRIVYAEYGSFDAFSPFIVAGKTPYGFKAHIYESFLTRSIDESFSLYCLICESVDLSEDYQTLTFVMRENVHFSDGTKLTVDDVIWSYNILAEKGLSKYARYMSEVTSIESLDEKTVRFHLQTENRELPLLLGMMPLMKAADFAGVEFDAGMQEPTVGTGAYKVSDYKMGEYIAFARDENYWGKDLPINRGLNNLDEIRYIYFTDADAMFEAFKAGDVNIFVEGDPRRWESYDFDRYQSGEVDKIVIQHSRPNGMDGFVFNTRNPALSDWRVREALITGFNFAFINKTINEGLYPRRESYFANSYLGMSHDAASGEVLALLEPYADELPEGAIEGYSLPKGDESGRDRAGIAAAMALLNAAGYQVEDGVLVDQNGAPLELSVLLSSEDDEKIANLWADGLKPLGVTLSIEKVDEATKQSRLKVFDFDLTRGIWGLSLSPGYEQYAYWGSESADVEGSRNYMGAKSPAIDAMIASMLSAQDIEHYTASVKALDRILMAERYIVPFWHNPEFWIIKDHRLKFPNDVPKFGYWPGYSPDALWWEE